MMFLAVPYSSPPTMQSPKPALLPKEQMELQISQVDLLMGTYPGEKEMVVDDTTSDYIDTLREWACSEEGGEVQSLANVPSTLTIELNIGVNIGSDGNVFPSATREATGMVQFSINVPVRISEEEERGDLVEGHENPEDEGMPPSIHVRLRQPSWMSKMDTAEINDGVTSDCDYDDPVGKIEYIRMLAAESFTNFLTTSASTTISTDSQQTQDIGLTTSSTTQPIEKTYRVWFYFPSLSTRAKRNDLVHYAPIYSLTGFVLAGKPGILCLEGTEQNVDSYMRYIKTESWGDIPSHHKKVSERYREVINGRVFSGMQEITDSDWMGEKRGERGNRSDMKALEGWLDGWGLKGSLQKVLM